MINADFFTSGIDSDILMNVLEYFIIFLVWVAWVLFNLKKQKQRYSVWSFNKNANIISSRYSEINKFTTTKDLTFQKKKKKKHTKKDKFQRQLQV